MNNRLCTLPCRGEAEGGGLAFFEEIFLSHCFFLTEEKKDFAKILSFPASKVGLG